MVRLRTLSHFPVIFKTLIHADLRWFKVASGGKFLQKSSTIHKFLPDPDISTRLPCLCSPGRPSRSTPYHEPGCEIWGWRHQLLLVTAGKKIAIEIYNLLNILLQLNTLKYKKKNKQTRHKIQI